MVRFTDVEGGKAIKTSELITSFARRCGGSNPAMVRFTDVEGGKAIETSELITFHSYRRPGCGGWRSHSPADVEGGEGAIETSVISIAPLIV
jgi:hypothetical protein